MDKANEEEGEEDVVEKGLRGMLTLLERLNQAPQGGRRDQGTDPTAITFYHRHLI